MQCVFCLAPALFLFTKIFRSSAEYLRKEGILIHFYFDDWIIRARCKWLLVSQANRVMSLARKLGIIINLTKSNIIPQSCFIHLGINFDLAQGHLFPTQDSLNKIKLWSKYLHLYKKATARVYLSFLGILNNAADMVSLGRFHLLPLQYYLKCFWRAHKDSLNTTIMLDQMFFISLTWLENPQNLTQEATLHSEKPSITILTDTSKKRWGGGSPGRPSHISFMVANRILSRHKCTGDESSNINTKTLHASNQKEVCSYNVRQYNSSLTHKETEQNTLPDLNHQLPLYVSPFLDMKAWQIDALTISWENIRDMLFSPQQS